jgi:hypothetical protein
LDFRSAASATWPVLNASQSVQAENINSTRFTQRQKLATHTPATTARVLAKGAVRLIERRRESRISSDLQLEVWGIDARGEPFQQFAQACDISLSGALLSVEVELRSGDLIGVLYAGKKARYRVVWVSHSGKDKKVRAAVHRVDVDECPWQNLLPNSPAPNPPRDHA